MAYFSKKPRAIGDLLKDFVDDYPARKKLKRGMVLSVFPKTAGKRIMEQVEEFWFTGNKLFIKVKDQAWRQELHLQRNTLKKKLNDSVREEIVEEIIVR